MYSLDILIQKYFAGMPNTGLTEWLYVFTTFFDVSVSTILLVLCIALLIAIVRNVTYSVFFLSALSFSTIVVYLLKTTFRVTRPENGFVQVIGHSFPSFHATISTVFFILLIYIFRKELNSHLRRAFNTVCILGIIIVAFSRVYLNVHWFSDVFLGVLLGVLISYFSIIIFTHVMNATGRTSMVK